MGETFKIGDRVEFTKGFRKGERGILVGLTIAGVPWYSVKMDGGYIISGQFEGDFKLVNEKKMKA